MSDPVKTRLDRRRESWQAGGCRAQSLGWCWLYGPVAVTRVREVCVAQTRRFDAKTGYSGCSSADGVGSASEQPPRVPGASYWYRSASAGWIFEARMAGASVAARATA